jgi:hypothetical protein
MHEPVGRNSLLHQADAAIATARQLQRQLSDNVAAAYAQCRRARQAKTFQAGLDPVMAISLLVRRNAEQPEAHLAGVTKGSPTI